MFEIENDNGEFIYPNRKLYVGIIDIEIINNTYFNIDNKDYNFDTGEKFELIIRSKSDDPISKSKSLRIETCAFDLRDDARNTINSYLDSLRIVLLKRDFSYRTPLITNVKEVHDPRDCVGTVEIKLQNDARLNLEGKERFHNENGSWYRLYSKQGISICESDILCLESSAYEESEAAKQAIDAIYPKIKMFLMGYSIKVCEKPKTTVSIDMSADFRMGIGASATFSKLVPFDKSLLKSSSGDVYLHSVLALLEHKGLQDLPNLYNILELIERDMGENSQIKNRDVIEVKGLSTKDDIEKFTYTVNHVDVIGLEHVRHGAKFKGNPSPEKALTIEGCRSIMRSLINRWLDYKMNHSVESP